MLISIISLIILGLGEFCGLSQSTSGYEFKTNTRMNDNIKLPKPVYDSEFSVEQAMHTRRSVRTYSDEPLALKEVSQLLWAAQGITDIPRGYRTAPSAGALYPLEVYTVIRKVAGVANGVYKYSPHRHKLVKVKDGIINTELASAALGQSCIEESAMSVVFAAVYERTTQKYGNRGVRYTHMEAGHAAQNVFLQAVALNLGTVVIGAFKDEEVRRILNMPGGEQPLYIMPVGKK